MFYDTVWLVKNHCKTCFLKRKLICDSGIHQLKPRSSGYGDNEAVQQIRTTLFSKQKLLSNKDDMFLKYHGGSI